MANYGKRVNVFSSSGGDPVLEISDEEFRQLEEVYGQALSPVARRELATHAESYFRWRIAELNSESFTEVRRRFDKVKEAAAGFQRLAYGELTPIGDAGSVLEGILNDHMRDFPVKIRENQLLLLHPNDDSNEWKPADAGGAMLAIRFDADFLMEVAISLGCAIAKAEKDIASQEAGEGSKGFTPGNAFPSWLIAMRTWAINHGFRYGALTAEGFPSRFTAFLFELNKLFSTNVRGEAWKLKGLREPVASAEALAERLRKVSRAASKIEAASMGGQAPAEP